MNVGALPVKIVSAIQTHDPLCRQKHVLAICYVCEFIKRIREDERNRLAIVSKVRLSTNARDTSRSAAEKALPRSGTRRKEIFDLIAEREFGLTDDEIEVLTGLTHQTASATRNSLMRDGLIVASGGARTNRRGNASIVWKVNT
jgi:Fic family protein